MPKHIRHYILRITTIIMAMVMVAPSVQAGKKKTKKPQPDPYAMLKPDKPAADYKAQTDTQLNTPRQPQLREFANITNHVHGIDVSHYQGRIDWARVAKSGSAGYVYLKATESNTLVDDTYEFNLHEARRHGLKVGSYHFFRPGVSASAQFENFRRTVNRRHQDLLPLIDVEVTGGVAVATMHARLQEFLKLVTNEYGQRPIIYTGKNFYNKYFAPYSNFKAYKFMIAQYTPQEEPYLNGGDDYLIWQYTGHGRVDGIKGDVDQSRFVGHHNINDILYHK